MLINQLILYFDCVQSENKHKRSLQASHLIWSADWYIGAGNLKWLNG